MTATILALFGRVSLSAEPTSEHARPNILFIFADDHAYQAIGAYGSKINQTPNIDRLAREGMRFDNCYVTNSLCGPSRACILTGKYSHLNGFYRNGNRFDGSQQTFPKLLQQAGYQTALVGKWHLASDPTGFNYWHVLPGQGVYYNPRMIDNGQKVKHVGYTTNITTDLALDWLKNDRDPTRPFMVMCQQKAPHRNWMPAPEHLTMYDDVTIPEPETFFDDYSHRASPAANQKMEIARDMNLASDLKMDQPLQDSDPATRQRMQRWQQRINHLTEEQRRAWKAAYDPKNEALRKAVQNGSMTEKDLAHWKYQRYIKDYLRCVASVDDSVGRLLQYLDEAGLADNTVVVYTSDQGFFLGEHGWFDKRWMYEESLRTPLVVRWPGVVQPGSTNAAIVSNLDFAETFLDMAGIAVPEDMQGRSLVPLLRGQQPDDWRKSFYYHFYEGPEKVHAVARHYGVADGRHKLIHYYETDEWEMFDLEKDPHELHSVYGDPAYAELQASLHKELDRLRGELQVPETDPPRSR